MNKSMIKNYLSVTVIVAILLSIIMNFNLVGAFIVRDWDWIVRNWVPDLPSLVFMSLMYTLIHLYIVFTFIFINKLKKQLCKK
jgi:hypothetical protein